MDILQSLVRANALLLQGAYQGAEHVLDYAIVGVRELVAENARLQSIIDEANAWKPSITNISQNRIRWFNPEDVTEIDGEFYINPTPAQQSPAVAVPDDKHILFLAEKFMPSTYLASENKAILWFAKACIDAAQPMQQPIIYEPSPRITEQDAPIALTDEQVAVLGRPNFACSSIARVLVHKGVYAEIPPRSENEQAVAIHFLNSMLEKHGSNWKLEAEKVLNKPNDKPDSVNTGCTSICVGCSCDCVNLADIKPESVGG